MSVHHQRSSTVFVLLASMLLLRPEGTVETGDRAIGHSDVMRRNGATYSGTGSSEDFETDAVAMDPSDKLDTTMIQRSTEDAYVEVLGGDMSRGPSDKLDTFRQTETGNLPCVVVDHDTQGEVQSNEQDRSPLVYSISSDKGEKYIDSSQSSSAPDDAAKAGVDLREFKVESYEFSENEIEKVAFAVNAIAKPVYDLDDGHACKREGETFFRELLNRLMPDDGNAKERLLLHIVGYTWWFATAMTSQAPKFLNTRLALQKKQQLAYYLQARYAAQGLPLGGLDFPSYEAALRDLTKRLPKWAPFDSLRPYSMALLLLPENEYRDFFREKHGNKPFQPVGGLARSQGLPPS